MALEMRMLQGALLALGYELPRYGADGHWGAETARALESFARDMRIPGDYTRAGVAELARMLATLRGGVEPPKYVQGVDVSGWQAPSKTDWAELREDGIQFAYIKAIEGCSPRKSFGAHWDAARAAGVLVGAYSFISFKGLRKFQPREQAEAFARMLEASPGDLPPALDVEWQYYGKGAEGKRKREADLGKRSSKFPAAAVVAFVEECAERMAELTGRTPVLYTGRSFWRDRMHKTRALAHLPLWQAAYTGDGREIPADEWPTSMTPPWDKVAFWQFAGGKGRAPDGDGDGATGFRGALDRNLFNGSRADLEALCKGGSD